MRPRRRMTSLRRFGTGRGFLTGPISSQRMRFGGARTREPALRPSGTADPLRMRTCALYGHSEHLLGAVEHVSRDDSLHPPRLCPPAPRDTRDRGQQPPGSPGLPVAHHSPHFRSRSARPVG